MDTEENQVFFARRFRMTHPDRMAVCLEWGRRSGVGLLYRPPGEGSGQTTRKISSSNPRYHL